MQSETRFSNLDKMFWANVRVIGQELGYTQKEQVRVFTVDDMARAMAKLNLDSHHLMDANGQVARLGMLLKEYFLYRANVLNTYVEPRLMDAARAAEMFNNLYAQYQPACPIPMNKQKGGDAPHA